MSIPIIEKILGNDILTINYIKDTIDLTKSINIKNNNEAIYYNKYIELTYPSHVIDVTDKSTWRYYKHLLGEYHLLDTPITITSLDNGDNIILSKDILNLHVKTKKELLKFSLFYKELINKYPEQELYIKSVISYNRFINIQEIINQQDFTIISYNSDLIEENESDLIFELQDAIDNYKHTRMIPYYSLSDSLFLATQYHILYTFILTKILAIRLKNAKTLKAHTYHIKNYLASHHYLDKYYTYLTKKQSLFLYRNLLYLDNHSGKNNIFRILIDKLFTDRNISIVNYNYKQINEIDDNNFIKYKFNQKLLNNANLIYSINDFNLENIKFKEFNLTNGNPNQLTYHLDKIDSKFKNSLFNILLTKDLESMIIDNTDTVRYKFIPILIDYWAYLLKLNKINFIVTVVNPSSNKEVNLRTNDLFKLFIVALYKYNGIELEKFPNYTIKRVFKEILPSTQDLLDICYNKYYWYYNLINEIKVNIPKYNYIATSSQFEQFITEIYKLNIGLWIFLSNLDDIHTNGQFELIINRLNTTENYILDNETVEAFLNRINFTDIFNYDISSLEALLKSILNSVYDNKLDFLNKFKYIQKTLIEVFQKFNSYTTQIIDNYYSSSPIINNTKDIRYFIFKDFNIRAYNINQYLLNIELNYKYKNKININFINSSLHTYQYKDLITINFKFNNNLNTKLINKVTVLFNNSIINDLSNSNWIVNQSSDDQLEFLATNL